MNLQNIYEALAKMQEKDAVSLTHPNHELNHTYPKHDTIHPSWIKQREKFLEKHPLAKQLFTKGGEKRDWQIRFPIELNGMVGIPNQAVTNFLRQKGAKTFTTAQYREGTIVVTKTVGDPERGIPHTTKDVTYNIGKFLRMAGADRAIIKAFENDPFRGNQDNKYDMIITGHPIDIYGGSTGRGWTSCMNVGDKKFDDEESPHDDDDYFPSNAAAHLKNDIEDQHHMVYLVKRGGDIDHDAIARTSFKLHFCLTNHDGETLIPEGKVYGTAPPDFLKIATEKMKELFKIEDGLYIMSHGMYNDSSRVKTVGKISAVSSDLLPKIRTEYNRIEEYYDDFDEITDAKREFMISIASSIDSMNNHDAGLIIHNLLDKCEGLIAGEFRFSDEEPEDDMNKLNEMWDNVFGDLEDLMEQDFEVYLLAALNGSKVNYAFEQTNQYKDLFAEIITRWIDDEDSDIEDAIDYVNNSGLKSLFLDIKFTSLYRFMIFASRMKDIDSINMSAMYRKYFNKQPSSVIIGTLFKQMVRGLNENEDWADIEKIFKKFNVILKSMIDVDYKTLDLFRIIEEDFGTENIRCTVDDMHTPKDWFEYAIEVFGRGYFKLIDGGGISFIGNDPDRVKKAVEVIKSECSEQSTIARIAELVQSEHFNMIEMFGVGSYKAPEKKSEPEPVVAASPKNKEPEPAPSHVVKNAKYRNPETGATWTGRGLKPRWVVDELAKGKTLQDLEI